MNKRLLGSILVGICFICFAVVSCSSDDSSSSSDTDSSAGGAGADFDASQYYTKDEVNALLPTVAGEVSKNMSSSVSDYASGVQFNQPTADTVLLFVWTDATGLTSSMKIHGGGSDSSSTSYDLPIGYVGATILYFSVDSDDFRFWVDATSDGINILPLWLNDVNG